MYRVLGLEEAGEWTDYLNLLPKEQRDVYYTPEYYQLYEEKEDGIARCFVFSANGSIALYPFLVNSINALGYDLNGAFFDIQGAYGYNGVVSNNQEDWFVDAFYRDFSNYCQANNIIAESTRFHPLLSNYHFSERYLEIQQDRNIVWLNISKNLDQIWWKDYSPSNRNRIRKAMRSGVVVEVRSDEESYSLFGDMYLKNMVRVNARKCYHFGDSYFQSIRRLMNGSQKLLLAKRGKEVVGGVILFLNGEYAYCHLSSQKSIGRKIGVNNLFVHEAIKYARESGCELMHLGGGTSDDPKDTLLRFKKNFSKSYKVFRTGNRVHNREIYDEVIKQWSQKYSRIPMKQNTLLKYRCNCVECVL